MSEAEDVSQVSPEAKQLDKYLCRDLTSEFSKDGAGLLKTNQADLKTKVGDASNTSSSCMSIELIDKSSNCRQPVKEPPCEANCQILPGETSEQIDLGRGGSLQSNFVKPCSLMSGFSNSERQKDDDHDSVDELKREIIGETSKVPDNSVSELKLPGGCTEVPDEVVKDQVKPSFQDISNNTKCEQLGPLLEDKRKCINNLHQKVVVVALKSEGENCNMKKARTIQKASNKKKSGMASNSATPNGTANCRSSARRHRETPETKVNSDTQEKSAAKHDSQLENGSSAKKRGIKKKQRNKEIDDEFSRMRVHLKYLLHRIRSEQNLLDAYSCEGWRGQSLEKLRPEKELERAKMDINRSKLKIRAVFQRLDEVCAEGQFPKSLFDSEGLVDSEDIFCAKCGCKDLTLNNDIILCDGACDRGFHQLCLDPPLRTEEIPPGDEGWYCPACDCKFDCVELLNDSMGTKLSMSHGFEKVFPEATVKAGSGDDDMAGLPSDDSEDDDFNPGGADDDNAENGESSSDESDFSSASEDLGAIHNTDDQYLGLPSDDSEDEDFEPNFQDAQDQPEQEEGSSSDFTSASEDLHAVIENDEISSEDKNPKSPSELVQDCEDIEPVTGRRQTEKLDYKKLYDEAYGNNSTDSSDDEDWQDAVKPKKRKKNNESPSNSSKGEEYTVTPKRRRYGPRNVSSLTNGTQAATVKPSKGTRTPKNGSTPAKDTEAACGESSKVTRTPKNGSPLAKDIEAAAGGSSKVTRNTKNVSPLVKDTQAATGGQSEVTRYTINVSPPDKDTQAATGGQSEVTRYTINVSPPDKDTQAATPEPRKVTRNMKNVSPLAKDTKSATPEPKKVTRKSKNVSPLAKDTQAATPEQSKVTRSTRNSSKPLNDSPTPYTRLGEDAIQILNASFEKNKYPDRSTKQKLAEELGISADKVTKWFGTTRWAANHSATGDGSSSGVNTRGRRKV